VLLDEMKPLTAASATKLIEHFRFQKTEMKQMAHLSFEVAAGWQR